MKKKNLCGLGLLCVALAASACTIGDVEERAEVSMTTSTDVDPRPTLSGQTMVPDADAKGDGGKSDKEPAPAGAGSLSDFPPSPLASASGTIVCPLKVGRGSTSVLVVMLTSALSSTSPIVQALAAKATHSRPRPHRFFFFI